MSKKYLLVIIYLSIIMYINHSYGNDTKHLKDLIYAYKSSPYPSFKVTHYFEIYSNLFSQFRGKKCTFIEVGVLNGGSLFMWKSWLGKKARIIGIDLNPQAKKWEDFGFEIYIGDQGDAKFWVEIFKKIGKFDVLLDDGGHQSFQQIVTLVESLKAIQGKAMIVIEDTSTSYMKEFSKYHKKNSFLQFSKDATDNLVAKMSELWPGQFHEMKNIDSVRLFQQVNSIEFFTGMVVFKVDSDAHLKPELIWNHQPQQTSASAAEDYRYNVNTSSATVNWPNPFDQNIVTVQGTKK